MISPRFVSTCVFAALIATLVPAELVAENWPQWRGPRHDGTSTETGLPTTWGPDNNVRWRLELPGPGVSTPVVWDDLIFLTSTVEDSDELVVLAVDRDGKIAWKQSLGNGTIKVFEQFAIETNLAAPSPVADAEHVWVLLGTAELVALDHGGEIQWRRDLAADYGRPKTYFGLSSSPLLHDGRLILQFLHTDRQLVLALDPATGKELWAHERTTDARDECLHAYTTPVPFPNGEGDDLVLIHGADYLTAHRAADGGEAWRYGTLNPKDGYNPMFRLVASPTVAAIDDGAPLVIAPTAKRGPVHGLRPTAKTVTSAWTLDRGTPDVPSPLIADGLVYLAGENGRLTVLDATTGETVYAERVHQSTHRGSPILVDGKLMLTGTDGTVSVIRAGREYELLAKNALDERIAASPAISDGTLYLRSYEALFAIGEPTKTTKPKQLTAPDAPSESRPGVR